MRISDWSSDVCSSDLNPMTVIQQAVVIQANRAVKRARIASSSTEKPSAARIVPSTRTAPRVEATTRKRSSRRRWRGLARSDAGEDIEVRRSGHAEDGEPTEAGNRKSDQKGKNV